METNRSAAVSSPAHDVHVALGGRFAAYRDALAVADYGESPGAVAAEESALTSGCAVFDRSFCGRLVLAGEDRRRFLNGQVTCAVKDLSPGEGTYGFLTSLKGRVEAELVVLATDDELWLDLPPARTQAVHERLAKYVLVDRVRFAEPEGAVLTLLGPRCLEVVAAAAGVAIEALPARSWLHVGVEFAGVPVRLVREPEHSAATAGAGGLSLWLASADVAGVLDALRAFGAVPVGWQTFERLRLDQGRPLSGVDFGDDTFPQETGLEDSVSYTKGCYLGQEVVARIHYRGGVQRHMRRLALDRPVDVGAILMLDDKPVGRLTSVARSLRGGGVLGLAVVHQRAGVGAALEARLSAEAEQVLALARVLPPDSPDGKKPG